MDSSHLSCTMMQDRMIGWAADHTFRSYLAQYKNRVSLMSHLKNDWFHCLWKMENLKRDDRIVDEGQLSTEI